MRDRLHQLPELIRSYRSAENLSLPEAWQAAPVLATGVGSSEAAAKLLVFLLQDLGIPASFRPFSAFYSGSALQAEASRTALVVFSQGLSPNARMVLERRKGFRETLLVTSSTPEGQRAAGRTDRAEVLQQLLEEGVGVLHHPPENEYDILPRFQGPVCSLIAAIRLAATRDTTYRLPPEPVDVADWFEESFSIMESESEALDELLSMPQFYYTGSTTAYAHNLSFKVQETLFLPAPPLIDAFTYAHGPFQRSRRHPSPAWLFCSADPAEVDLAETLRPMFEKAGPVRTFQAPVKPPWDLLYYEAALNRIVLRAAMAMDVDLVQWPGKGEDGAGYEIQTPRG